MTREPETPAALGPEALTALGQPEAGEVGAFAWSWPTFVRCARSLGTAVLVTFLASVLVATLAPGLPGGVLAALQKVTLWPGELLSELAPIYLVILLGNLKAAFLMALLGPLSVWLNAWLNAGRAAGESPGGPWTLPERIAVAMAGACVAAGKRVFPEIGDDSHDFAARSSVGLAAVLPVLAIWLNGMVAGLWLAEGLLQGWMVGLAQALGQMLPHGPLEFTALLLAAATGLSGAERLVPRTAQEDCRWQIREARAWLGSDRLAQSLGALLGLIAIAAALEMLSLW